MIIVDENIEQSLIDYLISQDYEVYSIRQQSPGISDREVIKITKFYKGIVLTEDKDFGELVFSHNIRNCSVLFLRYTKLEYNQMLSNLDKTLDRYYRQSGTYFITITQDKIRVRKV